MPDDGHTIGRNICQSTVLYERILEYTFAFVGTITIYIYSINERIMVHTKFITASLFQFPFRHILFAGGASASIYGKMTKVSSKSHIHHHLSTRTCLNSVQSPKMELTSVKVSI